MPACRRLDRPGAPRGAPAAKAHPAARRGHLLCSAAPWLYPTCCNENRRVTASGARRDLKELPVLALSGAFQPTNHEPPSATCRGIARGSESPKGANLPGTVS
eukprot:scaffold75840_cov56-Phaeocystis_antarctica.AAC.1